MQNLSLALKNLKNNLSFYALYLLSVAFVITIFFAFTSFSMNKVMLEKISNDGRVETMCNTISVFLMAFVVFYMSYSNHFFLRRRTKELGIYALLGYRKSTILSLLMTENLLTCTGAFITGILLGGFFHKGIVFGITQLLDLTVNNSEIPFFNPNAIMKTSGFIFAIVIVLAMSNSKFLFKTSLIDLVRYEKSAEKKIKFHAVPSAIGFYPVAMLTFTLILSGTVLFIASFLPFAVQAGKKNKRKFYTETKIITAPRFIYRIHSNSRTLIMLTLLSAATLTVSSVMALTLYYPIAAVSRMAPSEIECRIEDENEIAAIKQIISTYSSDTNVTFLQTDIYKVTSTAEQLPMEYGIGTSKGDANNEKILREAGFECVPFSAYKALLETQGRTKVPEHLASLNKDECILIKYQPEPDNNEADSVYPLLIGNEKIPVIVTSVTLDNPISFANSVGTLVISDELYHTTAGQSGPAVKILSINGKCIEGNEALFQALSDYLSGSPYLQGKSHRVHEIFSLSSSTFLLIGFLVVLFFIATGSILYFNNVSAVTDSKSDYEILWKMGYTDKKIKKIIKQQAAAFFSIPFLFGLADCVFGTLVYKSALMQNIPENSPLHYTPAMAAVMLTFLIYLGYYHITNI